MRLIEWIFIAFIVSMILAVASINANATTIYPPPSDEPCLVEAVRPYYVGCGKCTHVSVRGTGNVSIDDEGNATEIVSERVKCRGCVIEFRTDLACQPPSFPNPQP